MSVNIFLWWEMFARSGFFFCIFKLAALKNTAQKPLLFNEGEVWEDLSIYIRN